ncbi:hypothetical protein TNCT_346461 [Trichonephila clavata]|uniref:Uncharacterized protein n=1 Tax=Trichonephila clavata TaxID=2740835 RepID=A0A8X6LTQ5_TRICU|nr:hypothetical protein TNCT_346461 [Trichonephila clavata]
MYNECYASKPGAGLDFEERHYHFAVERRCPTKVITAREGERAGDRSSTAKFLGDSQKENVLRHVYSTNSVLVFFPFPSMKLFFLHGPRCLRATSSFYD